MHNSDQLKGWKDKDTVDFFVTNRSTYDDLYESERYFLTPRFIEKVTSVLDIGCAAGGFCPIFRQLNPSITYTGVDVTEETLKAARERFASDGNTRFYHYSGVGLTEVDDLRGHDFDLVYCSGLLHLIDNWKEVFRGMVELSSRYVLCDFRVCLQKPSYSGEFLFDYDHDGDYVHSTNYHVIHLAELLDFFETHRDLSNVSIFGYEGKANSLSRGISEVYMLFFKFEKGPRQAEQLSIVEIPDEMKPHLPARYAI